MGKQLPPIFFSERVTPKILEGRDCKGFTCIFFGGLKPEMAQLERRNCWDYTFNFFFAGESCSQRWHSWKGGTAGTTSSIFFCLPRPCSQRWHSWKGGTAGTTFSIFFGGGNPAASDGTVGREELVGLPLQFFCWGKSCSQ